MATIDSGPGTEKRYARFHAWMARRKRGPLGDDFSCVKVWEEFGAACSWIDGSMPRPLHCVNRSWACACGPCPAAAAERWMPACPAAFAIRVEWKQDIKLCQSNQLEQ